MTDFLFIQKVKWLIREITFWQLIHTHTRKSACFVCGIETYAGQEGQWRQIVPWCELPGVFEAEAHGSGEALCGRCVWPERAPHKPHRSIIDLKATDGERPIHDTHIRPCLGVILLHQSEVLAFSILLAQTLGLYSGNLPLTFSNWAETVTVTYKLIHFSRFGSIIF